MTDVFIAGLAALILIAALIVALTSKKDADAMSQRRDKDDDSMSRG